jgi:hypothetical protein
LSTRLRRGTTPEVLAVDSLRQLFPAEPAETERPKTLNDFLAGYIGTVEGTGESFWENCGEKFTDILVEKQKRWRQP